MPGAADLEVASLPWHRNADSAERDGSTGGGVKREGDAPEMVGVAGFVASGGDGDSAVRADEAFGFAEVVAQVLVDGDLEGAVFEGLQKFRG